MMPEGSYCMPPVSRTDLPLASPHYKLLPNSPWRYSMLAGRRSNCVTARHGGKPSCVDTNYQKRFMGRRCLPVGCLLSSWLQTQNRLRGASLGSNSVASPGSTGYLCDSNSSETSQEQPVQGHGSGPALFLCFLLESQGSKTVLLEEEY